MMERLEARILNLEEYYRLEDEYDRIKDSKEREVRLELLERIMEAAMDLDVHMNEYMYDQKMKELQERGVKFEMMDREPVVSQWDRMFDALVSTEAKANAKHYSDQFRWHLFSFELLNAVKGEDAGTKFDAAEKDELFLFFDYDDSCYRVTGADKLTVKDIMELQEYGKFDSADRYFFDPKRKWCYIMTHETEWCGPYFYHL
ncbi:MAG: DUF4275 family protein [Firmicutes bacterium]|nr:DUF4275 family protein [Bacillota bacterium]